MGCHSLVLADLDGAVQNEVSTRNSNYATIVRNLRFTPHLWYEPSGWSAGLDRRHEQKHARAPESSEFSMPQLSIEQMALQQQVQHALQEHQASPAAADHALFGLLSQVHTRDSCSAVYFYSAALLVGPCRTGGQRSVAKALLLEWSADDKQSRCSAKKKVITACFASWPPDNCMIMMQTAAATKT